MRPPTFLLVCVLPQLAFVPSVRGQLVQVRQDFSRDPGWDHYQNRIVGTEMPAVVQDFGWRRTDHTGGGPGEIGGRVENSRRQAYYAMPLGKPLTFDDELSASGKLALRHIGLRGVGYVGFFNSRRHTWRVWYSMAFRVWEEDGLGQVMFDWMSRRLAGPRRRDRHPAPAGRQGRTPGASATSPRRRADPVWHDKALERHITDRTGNGQPYELQGEEHLFERLKKEEPGLTREALHARLLKVRDQGLVEYFHRHDQHRWWKRPDAGKGHGRVTLRFDDETPVRHLVRRGDPAVPGRVRPLRPVQHRPVRHAGGDVPRRPDGQRPEDRPVAGPALGGAEQRVALHRAELPRRCTATAGRRRTGPARSPARSAACSGGPSRPTRSAPTTATTWAS